MDIKTLFDSCPPRLFVARIVLVFGVLIFLERPVTAEQLLSAIRIDSEALRLSAAERQPIVEELFTKIEYQLTKPGWNCVKKPQLDEPAINQTADELAHIANIRFVVSFEAPRLDQSGEMSIRVIANLAGRDITREVREDRFDRYPNRGKLLKIAAGSAVRELLDEMGPPCLRHLKVKVTAKISNVVYEDSWEGEERFTMNLWYERTDVLVPASVRWKTIPIPCAGSAQSRISFSPYYSADRNSLIIAFMDFDRYPLTTRCPWMHLTENSRIYFPQETSVELADGARTLSEGTWGGSQMQVTLELSIEQEG